ncbi:hypothetical protein [Sporomusa aerivorans]
MENAITAHNKVSKPDSAADTILRCCAVVLILCFGLLANYL